jgi:hypothetical protein
VVTDADLDAALCKPAAVYLEYLDSFFNSGRIRTVEKGEIILIEVDDNILDVHAHLRIFDCDLKKGYVVPSTSISY